MDKSSKLVKHKHLLWKLCRESIMILLSSNNFTILSQIIDEEDKEQEQAEAEAEAAAEEEQEEMEEEEQEKHKKTTENMFTYKTFNSKSLLGTSSTPDFLHGDKNKNINNQQHLYRKTVIVLCATQEKLSLHYSSGIWCSVFRDL